jgi:hypothetical protein
VETVSLRGPRFGTFAVPLEWTDKAPPSPSEHLSIKSPILDFRSLLDLVDLVQQLKSDTKTARHAKKGFDK